MTRQSAHHVEPFIGGIRRHRVHRKVVTLGLITGAGLVVVAASIANTAMFWIGLVVMFAVPFTARTWCRQRGCPQRGRCAHCSQQVPGRRGEQ